MCPQLEKTVSHAIYHETTADKPRTAMLFTLSSSVRMAPQACVASHKADKVDVANIVSK